MRNLMIVLCVVVCFVNVGHRVGSAADPPSPVTVQTISKVVYSIEKVNPPNLVVHATGLVPTGGYTQPVLLRAIYVKPPSDGIQDYFLLAVPPTGLATQVISSIKASDTWKRYQQEAPWLKGVRIHGAGEGIMVKLLGSAKKSAGERQFDGTATTIQDALDAALQKLDKALSEGGVADAMSNWTISDISGRRGGIAGFQDTTVTITATRTPPWE